MNLIYDLGTSLSIWAWSGIIVLTISVYLWCSSLSEKSDSRKHRDAMYQLTLGAASVCMVCSGILLFAGCNKYLLFARLISLAEQFFSPLSLNQNFIDLLIVVMAFMIMFCAFLLSWLLADLVCYIENKMQALKVGFARVAQIVWFLDTLLYLLYLSAIVLLLDVVISLIKALQCYLKSTLSEVFDVFLEGFDEPDSETERSSSGL